MDNQNKSLHLHSSQNIQLSEKDRKQNILLSGLPSTGVTVYFTDLMKQDIQNGIPTLILDPYGDISNEILGTLTKEQLESTAYIDVGNQEYPIGLNLLQAKTDDEKKEIANTVLNIMYALFDPGRTGIIGPRFEQSVRNAISTVLYDEKSTMLDIIRVLTDQNYVVDLLPKITDQVLKKYWTDQIAKTSDTQKSEILDYVIAKFMPFVTNKKIRNIVGQSETALSFDDLVSNKKVIIFDFSKLQEDDETLQVTKIICIAKLLQALKHRKDKNGLSLYIDQVEDYPTHEMTKLLINSRRYGISISLTTQRLALVDKKLQAELLRVGTLAVFRQSTDNAAILAPEFHKGISVDQLCMLPRFHMFLKTLQEGTPTVHEDLDNIKENYHSQSNPEVISVKNELIKTIGKPVHEVDEEIKSKIAL